MNSVSEFRLQGLDDLPDYFSAKELSRAFPISRATAYRLSAKGVIPCLRIGKSVIFSRERMKEWIHQEMRGGEQM